MEKQAFPLQKLDPRQRMLRGVIYITAVLLSGALLVGTWFSTIAAQGEMKLLATSDEFSITLEDSQKDFIIGSSDRNYYIITVKKLYSDSSSFSIIQVNDQLPSGITINRYDIEQDPEDKEWWCNDVDPKIVTCDYTKDLGPDAKFPNIKVYVDISSSINNTEVNNTAQLISRIGDIEFISSSNNIKTIIDSVDLELLKKINNENQIQALEGDEITYTLTINNHGPATSVTTTVTDSLSTLLTYTNFITETGNIITSSNFLTWTFTKTLGINVPKTLTIVAEIHDGTNGQEIINTANVTSGNSSDWDPGNNTDSATVIVGGMKITKSVSSNNIYVGELFYFNIGIINVGSENESNVEVTDYFTDLLDIDSYEILNEDNDGNITYDKLTHKLIAFFEEFEPTSNLEEPTIIKATFRANENTTGISEIITNVAEVKWGGSQLSRQSDQVDFQIREAADLEITKKGYPTYPSQDDTLVYTVTIENRGSIPAKNIVLTDTLGEYLTIGDINISESDLENNGIVTTTNKFIATFNPVNFQIDPGEEYTFDFEAEIFEAEIKDEVNDKEELVNNITVTAKNDYYIGNNSAESTNEVDYSYA